MNAFYCVIVPFIDVFLRLDSGNSDYFKFDIAALDRSQFIFGGKPEEITSWRES